MKIEDLKKYEVENELGCYRKCLITCPYCGYVFMNSDKEVEHYDNNKEIVECEICEKSFYTHVQIQVEYTSEPLENVIIREYNNFKEILEELDFNEKIGYENYLCEFSKKNLEKIIKLFEEYKEQFENREEN